MSCAVTRVGDRSPRSQLLMAIYLAGPQEGLGSSDMSIAPGVLRVQKQHGQFYKVDVLHAIGCT